MGSNRQTRTYSTQASKAHRGEQQVTGDTRKEFQHFKVHERLRLHSTCMVQIRKNIAPSIDAARGHTTSGARVNEVASPATEQNSSAPIAFRKPASLCNARCPIAEAARRAATATNPRIRGAIMLCWTGRFGNRHGFVQAKACPIKRHSTFCISFRSRTGKGRFGRAWAARGAPA